MPKPIDMEENENRLIVYKPKELLNLPVVHFLERIFSGKSYAWTYARTKNEE